MHAEELQVKGPRNHCLAEEYARTLDETMGEFRDLVREDRKDALKVMVKALKRRMTLQFEEMKNADVEVILKCIKRHFMPYSMPVTRRGPGYQDRPQ